MAYPGGKAGAGVYQQIINQIPPHKTYIEPFLGAGAVMLKKKVAPFSIGIDIDAAVVAGWNNDIEHIPPGAIFRNTDAISFLQTYPWSGDYDEFVYADPPYLMSTRSCKRAIYEYEFGTVDQHRELLELLIKLPCNVAISGYQSSLYSELLATWRTISYQTRTRGGGLAREWLWMNYPEPIELHDYRYLGANFRERERIKRIKSRWLARLDRMDQLEKYAILCTIGEYRDRLRMEAMITSTIGIPYL